MKRKQQHDRPQPPIHRTRAKSLIDPGQADGVEAYNRNTKGFEQGCGYLDYRTAFVTGRAPSVQALPSFVPSRIEYRGVIDKAGWERGPWDDEPDKVQWRDDATGLPCLIVRGPHGGWCGYVGVSLDHPWHGKDYDDVDAEVHGGLTFAHGCSHGDHARSICHVPESGQPDDVWWLGFDCAHHGDRTDMAYSPDMRRRFPNRDEVYRDMGYVTSEVLALAAQAIEARRAATLGAVHESAVRKDAPASVIGGLRG